MPARNFDFKDFNRIEVGGAFEVEIARSDAFNVSVSADDFSRLRVEQINGTLVLQRYGFSCFNPFHYQPRATVTLPALEMLDVSGASRVKFENFESDGSLTVILSGASQAEAYNVSAGKLEVKVSGASRLTGEIRAKGDCNIEASGASRVELEGMSAGAVLKLNGASKAELSQFPIGNASMVVSGASNASVNLNGRLDADVSGASTLLWSGSPVMGDIRSSGSSSLRRR